MRYEKASVDVIKFGNEIFFMENSQTSYNSATEALRAACGGYNGGGTNNFQCSDFGGYNATNPPTQKAHVELAGGTYVFDYVGNHWKCSRVS